MKKFHEIYNADKSPDTKTFYLVNKETYRVLSYDLQREIFRDKGVFAKSEFLYQFDEKEIRWIEKFTRVDLSKYNIKSIKNKTYEYLIEFLTELKKQGYINCEVQEASQVAIKKLRGKTLKF